MTELEIKCSKCGNRKLSRDYDSVETIEFESYEEEYNHGGEVNSSGGISKWKCTNCGSILSERMQLEIHELNTALTKESYVSG